MIKDVFTIGYSGFSVADFISTIKKNNISLVVDVRSLPYSQYYSNYNKDNIESILKKENIYYRNYAVEFGARQEDKKYYPNGFLDFSLFSKSKQFMHGFEKLQKAMEQNYTFVLMCGEKEPITCHRSILVAKAFYKEGYVITHLLPNNVVETQKDVEKKLVDKFFPIKEEPDFFSKPLSEDEYVEEAYKKQNALIGYKI